VERTSATCATPSIQTKNEKKTKKNGKMATQGRCVKSEWGKK
jgi:hypothetical protein